MTHPLYLDRFDTPLGRFAILVDARGRLRAAGFTESHARMERLLDEAKRTGGLEAASNPAGVSFAVCEYFAGNRAALESLEVDAAGTPFQRAVWAVLRTIPCGQTRSYGEVARAIGRPRAVRAVGLANGQNPVGVIVPCHRVIGADGSLTGYGGGVERKRWLLEHEAAPSVALAAS